MRRRSRTQECHFEKHRVPTMPYGPMGPPVARARPVRAHVAASEHARSLERGRAAAAFEERHVCSEGDQSRHAFRKPPPWAEDPQPSASRKASHAGVEKPALTHAQLDAALAVADALRADGLSLDAEKVLRTVLAVDPINAREILDSGMWMGKRDTLAVGVRHPRDRTNSARTAYPSRKWTRK